MKQTMKKCLTLLLALALLFTMAVPAAAAPATTYNKEITFTDVAQGDTVKAYKLVGYKAGYMPMTPTPISRVMLNTIIRVRMLPSKHFSADFRRRR